MRGRIYLGIILLATVLLGTSSTLADNPFNWQPYEHEEPSDDQTNSQSDDIDPAE